MNSFLSVLVPVHNGQACLAAQIDSLLDLLSDVSKNFQILIVDDASTDATDEIALDLAMQYVQVDRMRLPEQQGLDQAVEVAKRFAKGELILRFDPKESTSVIIDNLRPVSMVPSHLGMGDRKLVEPIPKPQALRRGLVDRLMQWGVALRDNAGQESSSNQTDHREIAAREIGAMASEKSFESKADAGSELPHSKSRILDGPKIKPRRLHREDSHRNEY